MKDKILELLRAKFVGTPAKVLDRVADHLSQTVTEESQLETAIDGVQPLVTGFAEILQSETDRRVTDATATAVANWRKKHGLDETGKPINQEPNPPAPPSGDSKGGDEMPAWAKGLLETVTNLTGTVEGVTKQNALAQKQAAVKAKLKSKGVPEKFMDMFAGRVNLESETMDEEIEKVYTEYNGLRQSLINEEVSKGNYTPSFGSMEDTDSSVKALNKWGESLTKK